MTPPRHVVVVVLHAAAQQRWHQAITVPPLASLKEAGYSWHVIDLRPRAGAAVSRLGLQRLIASPHDAAERLEQILADPPFLAARSIDDPEITLVACGRATRIIQQLVVDRLRRTQDLTNRDLGDVRSVRRLRQLVLINPPRANVLLWFFVATLLLLVATPVAGFVAQSVREPHWAVFAIVTAALAGVLGLLLQLLSSDEMRRRIGLRPAQSDAGFARQVREMVEQGAKSKPFTWPIPTTRLTVRGAVPESSVAAVPLAKVIARPAAHPNLYDVALFERRFTIRPVTRDTVPPHVRDLARPERSAYVFDDNEAVYEASITFSAANERMDVTRLKDWSLRYATSLGFIVVDPVHQDNLWEPKDLARYDREHTAYEYWFQPKASRKYTLKLMVYGGYTGEEQRSHCHLRPDGYYWRVREVLDLGGYIRSGWALAVTPRVTFRRAALPRVAAESDERPLPGLACDCKGRSREDYEWLEVEVRDEGGGVYSWEIDGVRDGGVLEFEYQLVRESHGNPLVDRPAAMAL